MVNEVIAEKLTSKPLPVLSLPINFVDSFSLAEKRADELLEEMDEPPGCYVWYKGEIGVSPHAELDTPINLGGSNMLVLNFSNCIGTRFHISECLYNGESCSIDSSFSDLYFFAAIPCHLGGGSFSFLIDCNVTYLT